jgi:hypothetical protein
MCEYLNSTNGMQVSDPSIGAVHDMQHADVIELSGTQMEFRLHDARTEKYTPPCILNSALNHCGSMLFKRHTPTILHLPRRVQWIFA